MIEVSNSEGVVTMCLAVVAGVIAGGAVGFGYAF